MTKQQVAYQTATSKPDETYGAGGSPPERALMAEVHLATLPPCHLATSPPRPFTP